jgi:hypothetical protein
MREPGELGDRDQLLARSRWRLIFYPERAVAPLPGYPAHHRACGGDELLIRIRERLLAGG